MSDDPVEQTGRTLTVTLNAAQAAVACAALMKWADLSPGNPFAKMAGDLGMEISTRGMEVFVDGQDHSAG